LIKIVKYEYGLSLGRDVGSAKWGKQGDGGAWAPKEKRRVANHAVGEASLIIHINSCTNCDEGCFNNAASAFSLSST
jgi:hypothetical protein